MAEHESSLAVLVNFENMARPGAKGRGDFDIHLVLNRLAEKGRVLVKRAYADWSRYRDARHELQNAGLGLIEMPSAREGAKNRADIQMAVNAMELAYSREHVNNFVIVSGDSDFTPLVGKLRELNKRVIGVGNRESASELLIANCDEFIFYDRLAAEAAGGGAGAATRRRSASGGLELNPTDLLRETLTALQREGTEWPLASIVKDSMRRKYPAFDESEHGFSTFSKFLEEASTTGLVHLETDPRSGTYRVELGEGRAAIPPLPTAPAAPSERAAEDAEGGRRRRRRGGRGRSGAGAESESVESAESAEAAQVAEEIAEVFEVVVTPTPDPDLGTLPPLDEPISYEDMIMLGPPPEVGEDVPDLAEATDVTGGAPSRSSRRRRRRGAGAEPEPTVTTWSRSPTARPRRPTSWWRRRRPPRSRPRRPWRPRRHGAVAAAPPVRTRPPPRPSRRSRPPRRSRPSRSPRPSPRCPPRRRPRRPAAGCAAAPRPRSPPRRPSSSRPPPSRSPRRPRRRPPSRAAARAARRPPSRPPRRPRVPPRR